MPPEAKQHLVSTIGSERATSGSGNKIVSLAGKTHVVWQDVEEEGYFNRVRTWDHSNEQWSEPVTLNQAVDNHARPVVALDREGHLHAVMSGHNSPVTYRRSLRPNDSSEWSEERPVGSGTYPAIACGTKGDLYCSMRSAERWNGVDFYARPAGREWREVVKVLKRREDLPGYAGYQTGIAVAPDGTLHLVCDVYESKGTYEERGVHQAVCYARSRDGGERWERADGTPIDLPARPQHMDALAEDVHVRDQKMPPPVILSQGCIAVDSQGRPAVLHISHLEKPGQVILSRPDEQGHWRSTPTDAIEAAFPEMRPAGCRGALTIGEDDTLRALLELKPLGEGWQEGKPTRALNFLAAPQKRLAWLTSTDAGDTWEVEPALAEGTVFNQANVEGPTGGNVLPAGRRPPFAYFDGTSRYAEEGEIIQNNVYVVFPQH